MVVLCQFIVQELYGWMMKFGCFFHEDVYWAGEINQTLAFQYRKEQAYVSRLYLKLKHINQAAHERNNEL